MNVIVAFSAGVLSAGFAYAHKIDTWIFYGLFSFFSTLSVYNGQRLFKSKAYMQTPWLSWVGQNRKGLVMLSLLSALFSGIVLLQLEQIRPITFLVLGVSGIISLFYVVKIRGGNMRQIPYLKIHLISISWVAVLVAFPVVNESINASLLELGIAHYLYVLAVTIPFDIRDLKYDATSQKTIPQVIGVKASKALSVFLLLAFGTLMIYFVDSKLIKNPTFFISVFVQIALVLFMNEKRSDMYCAGLIDGSIVLLGLSYFFL